MKSFSFIFLTFVSLHVVADSRFDCKFHDNYLMLESKGFEHIQHTLKINGAQPVSELVEGSWFIESVKCKSYEFEIVASHVQYNDPTEQIFQLRLYPEKRYQLKTGK